MNIEDQIKKDKEKWLKQKQAVTELLSFAPFNAVLDFFEQELVNIESAIDATKTADEAFMLVQQKKPIKKFLGWVKNLSQ